MEPQKVLQNLRLQNDDEVFLFSCIKEHKEMELQLFNVTSNEAFVGQAKEQDLRTQAAGIRLTFKEFLQKAGEALLDRPRSAEVRRFVYSLEDRGTVFRWKCVDEEETVVLLGSIPMRKVESVTGVCSSLLLQVTEEMRQMRSQLSQASAGWEQSKEENKNLMALLDSSIEAKECLEKEFLAKFVAILNEKKRKISDLKPSTDSPPVTVTKKFRHPLIESESDDEESIEEPKAAAAPLRFLDDELAAAIPKVGSRKRTRQCRAKEMTRATVTSSAASNSVEPDENESDDSLLNFL